MKKLAILIGLILFISLLVFSNSIVKNEEIEDITNEDKANLVEEKQVNDADNEKIEEAKEEVIEEKDIGEVSKEEIKTEEMNLEISENNDIEILEGVIEINGDDFNNVVLNSEKKVLVDFYADWCGPCNMLSPIVADVSKEKTDVKFVKVNVDNEPNLSSKYKVMYLPTLVVFENGQVVNTSVGLINKEQVLDLLN